MLAHSEKGDNILMPKRIIKAKVFHLGRGEDGSIIRWPERVSEDFKTTKVTGLGNVD